MNIYADFNELNVDHIRVSLRALPFGTTPPEAGEWVRLLDEDGATCWAIVEQLSARQESALCKVDLSTWRYSHLSVIRTFVTHYPGHATTDNTTHLAAAM